MEKTIGQILVEKLTADELEQLCDAHEDGSIEDVFYDDLYPENRRNNPESYADPTDEDAVSRM